MGIPVGRGAFGSSLRKDGRQSMWFPDAGHDVTPTFHFPDPGHLHVIDTANGLYYGRRMGSKIFPRISIFPKVQMFWGSLIINGISCAGSFVWILTRKGMEKLLRMP